MAKNKKSTSNLLEVQNAAKTLFANIRFQSIDKQIKSVLLTSSVPDEGKTTTAWYLAQAAATAGNSVLLVEADLRRRSVARMLNLHPQHGIVSVLTGSAQLRDAVVPTGVRGLYFLDAEPSVPNPADLFASKRMKQLNEQLAQQFDYVIYDTSPVGTFVDAAVLGRLVDAAILVVRPGRVKRQELQLAYNQLQSADVNVIGACATFVEGSGSEYYYSYYTKDGRKKNDKDVMAAINESQADFAGNAKARSTSKAGVTYQSQTVPVVPATARVQAANNGKTGRSVPRNSKQSANNTK